MSNWDEILGTKLFNTLVASFEWVVVEDMASE
jgi:hypothetical protein